MCRIHGLENAWAISARQHTLSLHTQQGACRFLLFFLQSYFWTFLKQFPSKPTLEGKLLNHAKHASVGTFVCRWQLMPTANMKMKQIIECISENVHLIYFCMTMDNLFLTAIKPAEKECCQLANWLMQNMRFQFHFISLWLENKPKPRMGHISKTYPSKCCSKAASPGAPVTQATSRSQHCHFQPMIW